MRTQICPSVASATDEAGALAEPFVQVDGALGERQRLLVAVADQRDVGLVAVDGREHVVGLRASMAMRSACRSAALASS